MSDNIAAVKTRRFGRRRYGSKMGLERLLSDNAEMDKVNKIVCDMCILADRCDGKNCTMYSSRKKK